jgi:hypothetical protein
MSRTIKLEDHLAVEELGARYRGAKDSVKRTHVQFVWLLAQNESAKRTAEITGYSTRWVSEVARRLNGGGTEALRDHQHQNPGGKCLLPPGLTKSSAGS